MFVIKTHGFVCSISQNLGKDYMGHSFSSKVIIVLYSSQHSSLCTRFLSLKLLKWILAFSKCHYIKDCSIFFYKGQMTNGRVLSQSRNRWKEAVCMLCKRGTHVLGPRVFLSRQAGMWNERRLGHQTDLDWSLKSTINEWWGLGKLFASLSLEALGF